LFNQEKNLCKEIVGAVKKAEFITDTVSYIVLWQCSQYNGYNGLFPGGTAAQTWCWTPIPI